MLTDPVADMLTRIRNANLARHETVSMPTSKLKVEIARLLLDGSVDLGFVEGPSVPEHLSSRAVGRDRLVLVVPPGHPWARRRRAWFLQAGNAGRAARPAPSSARDCPARTSRRCRWP